MKSTPNANSTAVVTRPGVRNHGVVRRSGVDSSTSAIGVLMLHTVCRVRTNTVHGTAIPNAGTKPRPSRW